MLTKTAQETAVVANPSHGAHVYIEVTDSLDDFYPLTGVLKNALLSCDVTQDIDGHPSARVVLQRQLGQWSLSPGVNQLGGSEPLLVLGRSVKIFAAPIPADYDDEAASFSAKLIFNGIIEQLDWPDDEVVITCVDFHASACRDVFIEWERVYAYSTDADATKGALVWNTRGDAKELSVNDLVLPSSLNRNGHFYRVTAKTSAQASAEPAWPTGGGATVVSGGVTLTEVGLTSTTGVAVETVIQQIITDNLVDNVVTLTTPVSPSWLVRPYVQSRMSVLDAIETLSMQLGWNLRSISNAAGTEWFFTLFAPDRASATVHRTLTATDEFECTDLSQASADIRNVVRVVYANSATLDGQNRPIRTSVVAIDAASVSKYGRRFMELSEADTSQIDTTSEANTLAQAARDDLKDPLYTMALSLAFDPFFELGDRITIPSDSLRFGAAQTLAVQRIVHKFAGGRARTDLMLAGAPRSAHSSWLRSDARITEEGAHALTILGAHQISQTLTPAVSGFRATQTQTSLLSPRHFDESVELHVSPTAGFTPSSSTYAGDSRNGAAEVQQLIPAKTYYVKSLPFHHNAGRKILGPPSVEQSVIAGRAKSGHYDAASTQGYLPLNGNFEHALDDLATNPVDHWQVVTRPTESAEEWGSSGSVYYGEDFTTKGRYIELRAHATKRGNLMASPFTVRRGTRQANVYLSIMRTGSSAVSGKDLILDIELYKDSAMANLVATYSIFFSGDAAGPYPSLSTWYDVSVDLTGTTSAFGSSTNFLRFGLRRSTTGDSSFAWRVGDVYFQDADFYSLRADTIHTEAWTGVTFATNWANVGGGYQSTQYMKDPMGFVHLRGQPKINTGTHSATIFTLPTGYRPSAIEQYSVRMGTTVMSYVEIDTSGNVKYQGGVLADAQAGLHLTGFTFRP